MLRACIERKVYATPPPRRLFTRSERGVAGLLQEKVYVPRDHGTLQTEKFSLWLFCAPDLTPAPYTMLPNFQSLFPGAARLKVTTFQLSSFIHSQAV